jgi:hypothetical protein
MELTHGRLTAALIAGKIPVTDETLAVKSGHCWINGLGLR